MEKPQVIMGKRVNQLYSNAKPKRRGRRISRWYLTNAGRSLMMAIPMSAATLTAI